jgi:6-phospho-beta-glucosidase
VVAAAPGPEAEQPGDGRGFVVAVLGGGVSVVSLVDTLIAAQSSASTPPMVVRLHARRSDRLEAIARHCRARLARTGGHRTHRPPILLEARASLDDALAGADIVVNLIRAGGNRARSHDEQLLRWRGAPGDEGIGPGGASNAWRSVPLFGAIALRISQLAPEAVVLNMAAPLGVTTRAFWDAGVACTGLCELPLVIEAQLRSHGAGPLRYLGFNHLGVFSPDPATGPSADGALDHLATVAARAGLAATETVIRLGGVPLPYYHRVLRPDLGARLSISSPEGRAAQLSELTEALLDTIRHHPSDDVSDRVDDLLGSRPTPWFDQALVPALLAITTREPVRLALNRPNDDGDSRATEAGRLERRPRPSLTIHGVAPECIVEHIGRWPIVADRPDDLGAAPTACTPATATMLAAIGRAESLTYAASKTRDLSILREALLAWDDVEGQQVGRSDTDTVDCWVRAVIAGSSSEEPPDGASLTGRTASSARGSG